MRQFTMNIEGELLIASKTHALKCGTNLSELVRTLLMREIGWARPMEQKTMDDREARPVLLGYSQKQLTRRQAMRELGLKPEQSPDFVDAMNRLSVPWPTPAPDQIEREAQAVHDAIQDAADED